MGAPGLLHNISSPSRSMTGTHIYLQAGFFSPRPPVIPTARSVTVARVASPISMDRTYQSLFLRSLKLYFDSTKRLVKQGDLIAIKLNTDNAVGDFGDPGLQPDDSEVLEQLDFFNEQ